MQLVWLCLFSLALGRAAAAGSDSTYIEDSEHFPGWKGVLPTTSRAAPKVGYGELGQALWNGTVEQLSWTPRAFLLKQFLSEDECDYLVKHAPKLVASEVVDSDTGAGKLDEVRTSTGTLFEKRANPVIIAIEKRISIVTFLPEEHGEAMQILRYENGQKYEPHHDFFWDKVNARPETGGQRIVTVLMYLTTPEKGGETVFPDSPNKVTGPEWSDCAKQGLAVKAVKGDAVFFYSLKPNGDIDESSRHGSCPTTKGVKYSATKWIHVGPYREDDGEVEDDLHCIDREQQCETWAFDGECDKNPAYMKHHCRAACGVCKKEDAAA